MRKSTSPELGEDWIDPDAGQCNNGRILGSCLQFLILNVVSVVGYDSHINQVTKISLARIIVNLIQVQI